MRQAMFCFQGGFPEVLRFRPTFRLARLDMSEIILKGKDENESKMKTE